MFVKLSPSRKKALGKAADRFHDSLDEKTWAYLLGRGFTEDQVAAYNLGVVSANAEPAYEPFIGRLSIPFTTPTGVVALRYRCIEDHNCKEEDERTGWHKKYLQGKGEGDRLYNVGALHERHPAVAVCEGEIDTMFTDTHVLPAVGVVGATKWKPHWSRLFPDYDRVFAIGDGDKAGREFTDKICEELPNAQPVIFPKGQDVNSFFLEYGAEELSGFILGETSTT